MLTKDEVIQLKNNKDLITAELLEALRTTKEGKAQALEILDIPKDEEEYYLDSFGNRISFHGDRLLKKPYTKLKLSPIHIEELSKCFNDIRYFRDNYVRITTPLDGVNFPDLRPYQNQIIEALQEENEQYIILSPRQCVTGDTIVDGEFANITIKELFESSKDELPSEGIHHLSRKSDIYLRCSSGYYKPAEVFKTIPLDVILLTFGNGATLKCSPDHVLIDINGNEVRAKNAVGCIIKTKTGSTLCIDISDLGRKEPMYDVSFLEDHLYYTNNILSHNSGKSITIATWLAWLYCFSKNIVMGICANRQNLAAEFLKNAKDIIIRLPIWMSPGAKVWNITSIAGDNGNRILTDAPSDSSFRGYSCNVIVVDEAAYLNPSKFESFCDAVLPSQSSLTWKKTIFISTANGLNHFYQMVKGAKARRHFKDLTKDQADNIAKTHKVLGITRYDNRYDVEVDEPANGHRLIEVDWRIIPRYKENGDPKTPEEFKEEIIAKHGLVHFNQAYANCLDGKAVVYIKQNNQEYPITLEGLYEFMKNGDWQAHHLQIMTQSGWSEFQGIRKSRHTRVYAIVTQKRKFIASMNHRFYYNNKWNFSSEVKVGDIIDGSRVIGSYFLDLRYPNLVDLYDILGTKDHTYIASGTISHNCFIGSSYTLLSGDTMARLVGKEPLEQRSGILNIYKYPEPNHKYIMSVDPAKDGADGFAVCILDITKFPFKQVAACSTDIDYFLMPEHLDDWGRMYNSALIIVENNEGAGQSVADMLWTEYEYENLYFEKRSGGPKKRYPGFRTTPRSRKLILDTMKMFAENSNLNIVDTKTINELYTFILINGKYQADENCHDDRVMALALAFAPFGEIKNFADAKTMIKSFYSKDSSFDFTEHLTVGYFDA